MFTWNYIHRRGDCSGGLTIRGKAVQMKEALGHWKKPII